MNNILNVLYSSFNYALTMFQNKKNNSINSVKLLEEIKNFVKKPIKKKISRISPILFHKLYSSKRWYLTEEKYQSFLTGLYYLGYEKQSDRLKGLEKETAQFLDFYDKLIFFIGNYYKYTQSKKVNEKEDNEMQIAQVQFIKFLDNGKTCVIKNSKSYIYVTNYSKSDAKVQTDPEDFKYSLLKCATKTHNIVSSMLLFDEDEEDGHANTLIISYKNGCIWRVEPNIYYYFSPLFYDNLDRALVRYFNVDNTNIGLVYKGLYPYTLKSTPDHVGLCVMISALQLYIPRNMTHFNVKYYLLKFFEWEYHNIFHKKFDIFHNLNKNLIGRLCTFIHKQYKINNFEVNGKLYDYKQLKYINLNIDIKKIVAKRETNKRSIFLEKQNAIKYIKKEYTQSNQTVFDYIK